MYLSGALLALGFLLHAHARRPLRGSRRNAAAGQPVRLFDLDFDLARPYTLWAGVLGGSVPRDGEPRRRPVDRAATARLPRVEGRAEGPDRERVRHLRPDERSSSSIGVMLFAFFQGGRSIRWPRAPSGRPTRSSRPSSCATCRLSSRHISSPGSSRRPCARSPRPCNSLASALAHDVVGPMAGRRRLEGKSGLALGRRLTLFWTVAARAPGDRVLAAVAVAAGRPGRVWVSRA